MLDKIHFIKVRLSSKSRTPSRARQSLIILPAALGLALALVPTVPSPAQTQDLATADAPRVFYAEARRAPLRETLQVMGTVVAPRSTWIAAEVAGAVEHFDVRIGDRVSRGQSVARLRAKPLELRLAAARGELIEAEARHRAAELRLERMQRLADSEVVSSQTADDALYEVQSWLGRVQRLKAEVERFEDDKARTVVRAPFDGVIVSESTQVGQWIDVGARVVELVALDGLEARLDIPEAHLHDLNPGDTVLITSEARPEHRAEGTLRAVVPQASQRARTFPAFVSLPPSSTLATGVLVRGELKIGGDDDVLLIPGDALVSRDSQSQVFVIGADSTVRAVAVRPGDRSRGVWREIHGSSLKAGDLVVTHGNESLHDGDTVQARAREYKAP